MLNVYSENIDRVLRNIFYRTNIPYLCILKLTMLKHILCLYVSDECQYTTIHYTIYCKLC